MIGVDVFVCEGKVPEAVSSEVAAAFAALKGGLALVESEFSSCLARGGSSYDKMKESEIRIETLESVTLGVVISSIRAASERMRERLVRMEHQDQFGCGSSPLVLAHYGEILNGHVWISPSGGGAGEIQLTLSDKKHESIGVRQKYGVAVSFDAAYDRIISERDSIVALIEMMMATATDEKNQVTGQAHPSP